MLVGLVALEAVAELSVAFFHEAACAAACTFLLSVTLCGVKQRCYTSSWVWWLFFCATVFPGYSFSNSAPPLADENFRVCMPENTQHAQTKTPCRHSAGEGWLSTSHVEHIACCRPTFLSKLLDRCTHTNTLTEYSDRGSVQTMCWCCPAQPALYDVCGVLCWCVTAVGPVTAVLQAAVLCSPPDLASQPVRCTRHKKERPSLVQCTRGVCAVVLCALSCEITLKRRCYHPLTPGYTPSCSQHQTPLGVKHGTVVGSQTKSWQYGLYSSSSRLQEQGQSQEQPSV